MHEKYGDENSFSTVYLLYEMSASINHTSWEKPLDSLFGIRSLSHSYNHRAAEKQVYQRMACQTIVYERKESMLLTLKYSVHLLLIPFPETYTSVTYLQRITYIL